MNENLVKLMEDENEKTLINKKENEETEISVRKNKNGEYIIPKISKAMSYPNHKTEGVIPIKDYFYYKLSPEFKICNNNIIYCRQAIDHEGKINYVNHREDLMKTSLVVDCLSEEINKTLFSLDDVYEKITSISQEEYYEEMNTVCSLEEEVCYKVSLLGNKLEKVKDLSKLTLEDFTDKYINKDKLSIEHISPNEIEVKYDVVKLNINPKDKEPVKIEIDGLDITDMRFNINL